MLSKIITALVVFCMVGSSAVQADVVLASVDGKEVPPHAMRKILTEKQLSEFLDHDSSIFSYEAALYDGELQFYWVHTSYGGVYQRFSKAGKLLLGLGAIGFMAITLVNVVSRNQAS